MTDAYNLKYAFDDLQKQLKAKRIKLEPFFYDIKGWRISEDCNEIFYSLNGKDCSIKVYPSATPFFEHRAVVKVGNREQIIETSKNILPLYSYENGRKCKYRSGLLELLVKFSATDF